MHPTTTPSGWLLGAVPRFDAMTDHADQVMALLAMLGQTDEVVELRTRVRHVDPLDDESVIALADYFAKRATELSS